MWQKCPICNGTGKLPSNDLSNTSNFYSVPLTCDVCFGKKIISEINGLPPFYQGSTQPSSEGTDFRDTIEDRK